MQIKTKLIENLAVTTGKIADLAVTTGKVAANAITGAKIRLANLEWLRGRNAADNADINIVRVNAADNIEAAGLWLFGDALPQSAVVPVNANDLVNKTYVDNAAAGGQGGYQALTLDANDILNQYKDLAQEVTPNTLQVVFGGVVQRQNVDYTLSTVGGVTRITFAGDLATGGAAELVATDVLECQYLY